MNKKWLPVREIAKLLEVSHRHVLHLIKKEKLEAELQDTPVPYYLVKLSSALKYKNSPRNKGGRPPKQKD